jgi:hypothetical protein
MFDNIISYVITILLFIALICIIINSIQSIYNNFILYDQVNKLEKDYIELLKKSLL